MPDSTHDLSPLNLPEFRRNFSTALEIPSIEFYDEIDSTQNRVRLLADEQAPSWTIVVADNQTVGRGQYGRSWISVPHAALMFSLLIRPRSLESLALLPIRMGLAVARALQSWILSENQNGTIQLKWPNDLIVDNGKLGGILCEGTIRGEECHAVIGVGINILEFTVPLREGVLLPPTSIAKYCSPPPNRLHILRAVVAELKSALSEEHGVLSQTELSSYRDRDWLRGREVMQPCEGVAEGINELGHLNIRMSNGTVIPVKGGSVALKSG